MDLFVSNETSQLESVILGIGKDKGAPRGINPSIRMHLENNTYPTEQDIRSEISTFEDALKKSGVQVLRTSNLSDVNQIFTRDIGFVIEDHFFVSNMKYPSRALEFEGIKPIVQQLDGSKVVEVPDEITMEGGDVILWNDYIFLGLGERTTRDAVGFLQQYFPQKTIIGFDLVVDPQDASNNILHLDCTFQPIGQDEAIIYRDGFKSTPDELLELFPKSKLIEITKQEKNQMFPNIFSVSSNKIVIEKGFSRLKQILQGRGYDLLEVAYSETSKLSGLLRCSTLPLKRKLVNA